MEKNLKKSSSILGIKQLNVLERSAVRGGTAPVHQDYDSDSKGCHVHQHVHCEEN